MLVLSRKPEQKITFPGLDITITVLRIGTQRVQIGIEAPADVRVSRPESGGDKGNSDNHERVLAPFLTALRAEDTVLMA